MTLPDARWGGRGHAGRWPAWWLFVGYVLFVTGLAAGLLLYGLASYAPRHLGLTIDSWQVRLTATADDRKAAVERWVEEGLGGAAVIASYPTVRRLATAGSEIPAGSERADDAREHLRQVLTGWTGPPRLVSLCPFQLARVR
jgi:hypothetical protein